MENVATQSLLRVWVGYLALCVGMFMAILDIQIVASSLPTIQHALGIATSELSWIQTSYLIAEIVAIPLTGWLTRLLSVRWLFVTAITGFTLASIGCAASDTFMQLIGFRILQGFCGGALIPIVFTSVFVMFPKRSQVLATTIGGLLAMLAPTVGPVLGGYITEHYSWHWLFLVNVLPGVVVAVAALLTVRIGAPDWSLWRKVDALSVLCVAICLASLELALKEGPSNHWRGSYMLALMAAMLLTGVWAARRCLNREDPLLDLTCFAQRRFAFGCIYSFVLGMGLFGSVYLMPLYLGFVREHGALEIGKIMMVMGVAQLLSAPVAAWAEKRFPARGLLLFGFTLYAAGLFTNADMTYATDYDELFWPQILRGVAVLFCLLPATALALEGIATARLSNASALFNLMRNLGGAISIALVDTMVEERQPIHVEHLTTQLKSGQLDVLRDIGFTGPTLPAEFSQAVAQASAPLIERAALVHAFNDTWMMLGVAFSLAVCLALFRVRTQPAESSAPLK